MNSNDTDEAGVGLTKSSIYKHKQMVWSGIQTTLQVHQGWNNVENLCEKKGSEFNKTTMDSI